MMSNLERDFRAGLTAEVCPVCAALVQRMDLERHAKWHDDQFETVEPLPARPPKPLCVCGHAVSSHHAHCLPPFDPGRNCNYLESDGPCGRNHCEWFGCGCASPTSGTMASKEGK